MNNIVGACLSRARRRTGRSMRNWLCRWVLVPCTGTDEESGSHPRGGRGCREDVARGVGGTGSAWCSHRAYPRRVLASLRALTDHDMSDGLPAKKRRLIEDWYLAIAQIGVESVRERTPMTPFPAPNRLHVWFARRPLVASRAANSEQERRARRRSRPRRFDMTPASTGTQ